MTSRPHQSLELIKQVLGDEYLDLRMARLVVEETPDEEQSTVKMNVVDTRTGKSEAVEGRGHGLVDALFHGLFGKYAKEYESLNSIEIQGFEVKAKLDTKKNRIGADAECDVTLEVRNSEGRCFPFSDASRSITSSAARATLCAVEYFVNAERAFVALYRSLEDAKSRRREDLVSRYTQQLSEVVKCTSYTEVIDRIKKQLV